MHILKVLVASSLVAAATIWSGALCLAYAADGPAGETTVTIVDGAVRGQVDGTMVSFLGIPYAKPPVGPLRWRPPEPPTPWQGVRAASSFGPMCPQVVGKEVKGAEDCLTINVWRPLETPKAPLPVMIWLTGGGNHSLSGEGTSNFGGVRYEGSQLVPHGVVFVTYNLRLGPLGFLALPALDAESAKHVSGNYGSRDQIAMLKWIHTNIAAFGGDPKRVFLFGTSAGGGNICALMTAPATAGLFQSAAMESSVPSGCEISTLAEAEAGTGKTLVAKLGCDTASDVAACMRAKDAKDVIAALPGYFSVLPRLYGPVVDGVVFPGQPRARIADGTTPTMPIIIGNETGETKAWADTAGAVRDEASYEAAIDRVFGAQARASILTVYSAASYPTPRDAFTRVTTDALFTCASRRIATLFAHTGSTPAYRYLFDHPLENDPVQKARGAIHTVEHPFFFGWKGKYVPTASDLVVQTDMVGYWTNMAKTGDPNGAGLPTWRETASNQAYLDIAATATVETGDGGAHCDFWDKTPPVSPHM